MSMMTNYALWFSTSQQPNPTQPLTYSSTSTIKERIRRVKDGKLLG